MVMAAKFLKQTDLVSWLEDLAKEYRTIVPRREADAVVFAPFESGKEPVLDRQATTPPKSVVFPQSDPLLTFNYAKDPEDPSKVSLDVTEKCAAKPTVVVGSRSCDARGFTIFDPVYSTEKIKDTNYLKRRENTFFVTLVCDKPGSTCFCNWTGGGPASPDGSDVLMTPLADGYVLESVSEKGEKLLASKLLTDAGGKTAQADEVKKKALEGMAQAPDLADAPKKLLELFDDMGFWESISAKCISCGACTYLCPTCYCFTITDEQSGHQGVRLRSWDNCMSFQFTLEASGHNPRPTKAHRLKNRVGHKFSYYPTLHNGTIACCGCGRCIKSCPVSVDIRQIVLKALETTPATQA